MRLLVHVEGQTEETFVNEVLSSHLYTFGYTGVSARLMGNARIRSRRGGVKPWGVVREEMLRHLRGDRASVATLMVDYYGMPSGDAGWPGRALAQSLPHDEKASAVESALAEDFSRFAGQDFDRRRFIPFVLMHEFEALLFSDCGALASVLGDDDLRGRLQAIRDAFPSPEHINDSPVTAPSKRLLALYPGYNKPLHGVVASMDIGLDRIAMECPGLGRWKAQLEALPGHMLIRAP
jgi:hypothetical protein